MKLGKLKMSPAGRVVTFVLGVVSAFATLRHLVTGVTRYGGVVHTRSEEPIGYWSVVVAMAFLTTLLFCAALLGSKNND